MSEPIYARQYAMYGAAFGFCFPVFSTILQAAASVDGISVATMVEVQETPLLWVIDTAPFFLGLFAWFAGKRQDALVQAMDRVEHANQRLEQANEELTRASRLKSQFLANMSHELRTPLNSIIGFSRILMRKVGDDIPERQARNLRMVHESGQHLLELVNDILDIERIEAGMVTVRPADADVVALAQDVITKLKPAAQEKGLVVVAELPDRAVTMHTDPVRLRQVLDNLVSNAIKYSDAGTVTLRVLIRPPDGRDEVRFVIDDEGIGIPKDDLPHIFDAFRQVDGGATRAQGGVGLGLHLVRRIATLLDGDVTVASEVGKGSTFTLSLPADKVVRETATPPRQRSDFPPEGHGPLVLIIDDSEEVIEINRAELVDAGYRVHATLDGRSGLELAAEIRPDVILLDIVMPEMDGWAVLRALRSSPELCSTPVVVTSMLADVPKAFEIGIRAWLTKPISQEDFKKIFDEMALAETADVLVVEDDRPTAAMLVQHLTDLSITARIARDGLKAFEALDDRMPNAMILDMMLPHHDGFEVLEALRKRPGGAEVPVIVYTAKDLTEEDVKRLNGGILNIVRKGDESGANSVVDKVREVVERTSAPPLGAS